MPYKRFEASAAPAPTRHRPSTNSSLTHILQNEERLTAHSRLRLKDADQGDPNDAFRANLFSQLRCKTRNAAREGRGLSENHSHRLPRFIVAVCTACRVLQPEQSSSREHGHLTAAFGFGGRSIGQGRTAVFGGNRQKHGLRIRELDAASFRASHRAPLPGWRQSQERTASLRHRSKSLPGAIGFGEGQSRPGGSGARTGQGAVRPRSGTCWHACHLQTGLRHKEEHGGPK